MIINKLLIPNDYFWMLVHFFSLSYPYLSGDI